MRASPDNYAQYDSFPIGLGDVGEDETGLLTSALLTKAGEITLPVGTIITFYDGKRMKITLPVKVRGNIVGNDLLVSFTVFEDSPDASDRKKRERVYTGKVTISPSAIISDKVNNIVS